jgi:hypothetical protein
LLPPILPSSKAAGSQLLLQLSLGRAARSSSVLCKGGGCSSIVDVVAVALRDCLQMGVLQVKQEQVTHYAVKTLDKQLLLAQP